MSLLTCNWNGFTATPRVSAAEERHERTAAGLKAARTNLAAYLGSPNYDSVCVAKAQVMILRLERRLGLYARALKTLRGW